LPELFIARVYIVHNTAREKVLSENSARVRGIRPEKSTISIGSAADLVVIDPCIKWEIRASALHSNAGYTPYEGWKVKGKPILSMLRGEV